MAKAKSTDPMKVAAAMEGLKFKGFNGDSEMRKSDHQMQQGLYISKWQKVDKKYSYSVENTGCTLLPVKYIEAYVASTPTALPDEAPWLSLVLVAVACYRFSDRRDWPGPRRVSKRWPPLR